MGEKGGPPAVGLHGARRGGREARGMQRSSPFGSPVGRRKVWVPNPFSLRDSKQGMHLLFG